MPATYLEVLDYFHFWPSRDLAIVALSVFLFASLTVLAMTIYTRSWCTVHYITSIQDLHPPAERKRKLWLKVTCTCRYMVIVTIVGLMEMGGYACRISMFDKTQYGVYVAMQCLLIIPPSFLALVQYITLGKVVGLVKQAYPERKLLVKPKAVIWGFFVIELLALALQGAGAGTSVSSDGPPQNATLGKALLIVGLVALVVLIVCYLITAVFVCTRPEYGVRHSPSLKKLFAALYACTLLLLTRNIFRLIEFSQGWYGDLATDEKMFYILDALLILLILVINTFFHFGLYLKAYPQEVKQGHRTPATQMT